MFAIRPETTADAVAIEALLDLGFGPDRRQKVSYRYREGVPPLAELCFVAEDETGGLVGAIRYWPIRLDHRPALLLGPLAIDPARQGRGVGRALVFHSLETAAAAGHRLVFLVGDPAYYQRFGFAVAPPGIVMPGEQPTRLNYRVLAPGRGLPRSGTLRPLPPAAPPSATPAAAGPPSAGMAGRARQRQGGVATPRVKAIATATGIP
jgi:predicted N-acetyltransferase YhbS